MAVTGRRCTRRVGVRTMTSDPQPFRDMNLLAISGSLRASSINAAFCRAVAQCAPASVKVTVFTGMGDMPLFNPDLEPVPPDPVLKFRAAADRADALLIASPEYAHGLSGVMKNALDWLVSHEGTVGKPIALINTSPRAHHAYDSLREVLQTMSTAIVEGASLPIPLLGAHRTEDTMLADAEVRRSIHQLLKAISRHLSGVDASGPVFPLA
jgi:chromate reductase, NAD(P)H dehydrogenase (quinone)